MKNIILSLNIIALTVALKPAVAQIQSYHYGVFQENDNVMENLELVGTGNEGGHVYVWNGFGAGEDEPYIGSDVLSFKADPGTWNGLGIQSDNPVDLSNFIDGYVRFHMLTSTEDVDFKVGIMDQDGGDWVILFNAGEDPYDFERNGEWHEFSVPVTDFQPAEDSESLPITSDNLAKMSTLFYLVGSIDVGLDEIYFSQGEDKPISSVNGVNNSERFRVYPNPANQYVKIDNLDNNTIVKISDVTGQTVKITQIERGILDIHHLKRGIYFLQFQDGNKEYFKKLIKK